MAFIYNIKYTRSRTSAGNQFPNILAYTTLLLATDELQCVSMHKSRSVLFCSICGGEGKKEGLAIRESVDEESRYLACIRALRYGMHRLMR